MVQMHGCEKQEAEMGLYNSQTLNCAELEFSDMTLLGVQSSQNDSMQEAVVQGCPSMLIIAGGEYMFVQMTLNEQF